MKLDAIGGGFGRIKGKISHKIIEYGGAMLTGTAKQEFEEGRLQDVGKILTKRVNFTAESAAATRPEFQDNRHRLNTKPGLIIANHPGKLDPFLLLSQIERTDLLVMVDTPVYAALVRELGPDVAQKQFVSNESSMANLNSFRPKKKLSVKISQILRNFGVKLKSRVTHIPCTTSPQKIQRQKRLCFS